MGSGSSKTPTPSNTNTHNNTNNEASTSQTPLPAQEPSKKTEKNVDPPSNTKEPSKKTEKNVDLPSNTKVAEKKAQKSVKFADAEKGTKSAQTAGTDPEALLPQHQSKFDAALKLSCLLIKPESIMKLATPGVQKLELRQALPHTVPLFPLLQKLPNLQIVDIAGNALGPVGFRAVMLSLSHNSTITTLSIAGNHTDTDSAECIGKMLSSNQCLTCLNVSNNYLGLDFFSRSVGPAMATNKTLKMLRCDSIGSTDLNVLGENLRHNTSLTSLSLAANQLSNPKTLVESLAAWLKDPCCVLETLNVRGTGMKDGCLDTLADAMATNSTLTQLDVSANQCAKSSSLMTLIQNCACHVVMKSLTIDDTRIATVDDWTPTDKKPTKSSVLHTLSMSGCSLRDDHVTALRAQLGDGTLSELTHLNLASNSDLTPAALTAFAKLSGPPPQEGEEGPVHSEGPSNINKLTFGHNSGDALPEVLLTDSFSQLNYLNLRRARLSPAVLERLAPLCARKGGVGTLVLDGIKLANTGAFNALIGKDCQLVALSVASCQLNDGDLAPLCAAVKAGAPLTMLKLADNRLTDDFAAGLCDALQSKKGHPLALIDISNNKITSKGAKRFADLLSSKSKSQLHSLNVSYNVIDTAGLTALAGCVGKTSLVSLSAGKQDASFLEDDCDAIFKNLTKALNLKVVEEGEGIQPACADIPPKLPDFLSCALPGLGGCPGELGKALHSRAVVTDHADRQPGMLTLKDALLLASHFKGQDIPETVMSSEEWSAIIGTKDTPSWLQVAKHRAKCVYMTALPASITTQKMEGLLETEADCNVDEVCLLKDMVTRKNNGLAWVLMSDEESVTRALQLYDRGEAQVFSQPFTIAPLHVTVDDEASGEALARQDMALRSVARRQEEAAHRALIERSYLESQARHAYRLAHPAYADGRIW